MIALKCMPPGFRLDVATELVNLIAAAYDEYKTPFGRASRWPLTPPWQLHASFSARLPFHETEAFGFVAWRADTGDVYVAFRGTESVDDWLINVELAQVTQQHSWGRVERGFANVYDQCSNTICGAIRDLGPRHVFVTGHSLGGALATLCAADVKAATGIAPTTYTFASPRTGDSAFAARLNAECPVMWRVVNTEDMITTVPPATSALEAKHPLSLARVLRFLSHVPLINAWVAHRMGWARLWHANEIYEHVGTPVDFTQNNGTVLSNHALPTYMSAIGELTGSDTI